MPVSPYGDGPQREPESTASREAQGCLASRRRRSGDQAPPPTPSPSQRPIRGPRQDGLPRHPKMARVLPALSRSSETAGRWPHLPFPACSQPGHLGCSRCPSLRARSQSGAARIAGVRVPPEVITGHAGGQGCSRNGVRAPPGREGHRRGREGRKALSWHFRVCVWRQLGAELLKMCQRRGWFKKA